MVTRIMRRRSTNAMQAGQIAMAEFLDAVRIFRQRRRLVLVAARGVLEARRRYHCNRDFARWLERSPYASLSKNDRASLIAIARHEKQVLRFLKSTGMASPTLLWRAVRRCMMPAATMSAPIDPKLFDVPPLRSRRPETVITNVTRDRLLRLGSRG
jgi:hypothetical protein